MKILLVEDDANISSFVKLGLEDHDHQIMVAFESETAEKMIFQRTFDVILLDVVLPGINGFELCKKLRRSGIKTPVIMLTSMDAIGDKISGFDSGADDYLTKPFSFNELNARINALHRRFTENIIAPTLKIADLEIDTILRKVKRMKSEIPLTEREFSILELLVKNKGKVFSKKEISEKIWGFPISNSNVIDVHVCSLRNKLDNGYPQKLIHTMIGQGYVMRAEEN